MFSKLFTKIVLPYDDSKHAKKALTRAMEVAHNLDSEILLFYVISVSHISPPGSLLGLTKSKSEKSSINNLRKMIRNDAEKMLEGAVKKCKSNGISAKYSIAEGNTSKEILDFAKKKKATIIIIGSQGLQGIGKLKSLGSTSRRISELAHCPVLIVR